MKIKQLRHKAYEIDEAIEKAVIAVLTTAQELTEEQKAQARANIAVSGSSAYYTEDTESGEAEIIVPSKKTSGKACAVQLDNDHVFLGHVIVEGSDLKDLCGVSVSDHNVVLICSNADKGTTMMLEVDNTGASINGKKIALDEKFGNYETKAMAAAFAEYVEQRYQTKLRHILSTEDGVEIGMGVPVILSTQHNVVDVDMLCEKISSIELSKFPNATIFGQPTIQQGQISNFSTKNFLQFPFVVDFAGREWLIECSITTGEDVSSQHNILDSNFGLAFALKDGKFLLALSSNGTSWNLGTISGSHNLRPTTTYYIRIRFDKSKYTLSYSTDKETWVEDISVESSDTLASKQIIIGKDIANNYVFNGIINLNDARLTISDELVWLGMDDAGLATRMAIDMSNIDSGGLLFLSRLISDFTYDKQEIGRLLTNFATRTDLGGKQDTLVSSQNIKTINGTSILGSGDLSIDINDERRYQLNRARLDAEYAEVLAASHDLAVRQITSSSGTQVREIGDNFDAISAPSLQTGDTLQLLSTGNFKVYARITGSGSYTKDVCSFDRLFSKECRRFKSEYQAFMDKLTEVGYLDAQMAKSVCSLFEGSPVRRINHIIPTKNCLGATGMFYGDPNSTTTNQNLVWFAGMDCSSLQETYNKRPGWTGNYHPFTAMFGSYNYWGNEANYCSQLRNLPIFRNLNMSIDTMGVSRENSSGFAEQNHIFQVIGGTTYQPNEDIDKQIIDFMDSLGVGTYYKRNIPDAQGGSVGQRAIIAFSSSVYDKLNERMQANPEVRSAVKYAMQNKNWAFTRHTMNPAYSEYLHP